MEKLLAETRRALLWKAVNEANVKDRGETATIKIIKEILMMNDQELLDSINVERLCLSEALADSFVDICDGVE